MRDAKKIYKVTGAITIILYIVGVFTGWALYYWTDSRSSAEIDSLRQELRDFNEGMEKLQMEQLYLTSYQGELGCRFLVSSIENAQSELYGFIQRLPGKLEVYEWQNQGDPAYEELKSDYMKASLRVWLLTLSVIEKCDTDMVPVVFFYSANEDSIQQGYELDDLRESNPDVRVFTIDINLEDSMVETIKEVYGVEAAPALLIGEQLLEGVQTSSQISGAISTNY